MRFYGLALALGSQPYGWSPAMTLGRAVVQLGGTCVCWSVEHPGISPTPHTTTATHMAGSHTGGTVVE